MNKLQKERRCGPHIPRAFDRRQQCNAANPGSGRDHRPSLKEEGKFFQQRVKLAGQRQKH